MTNYYLTKKRAGIDLLNYVNNRQKKPWSEFCRETLIHHGFDSEMMQKMLERAYPELTIKDDKVVSR